MKKSDKYTVTGAVLTLTGAALIIVCGFIWFGPTAAIFGLAICCIALGWGMFSLSDDEEENERTKKPKP